MHGKDVQLKQVSLCVIIHLSYLKRKRKCFLKHIVQYQKNIIHIVPKKKSSTCYT